MCYSLNLDEASINVELKGAFDSVKLGLCTPFYVIS